MGVQREILKKRIAKRKVREIDLKRKVPVETIKRMSFTKQSKFLSNVLVRLKMLIKKESTDEDGNGGLKPDKNLNATKIFRDSKVKGKLNHQKCIGKLINAARTLMMLRKSRKLRLCRVSFVSEECFNIT